MNFEFQMDEDDQFELDVPVFIEIKSSSFAANDLGAFCTIDLSSDQHIGNYKGKSKKSMAQCADPNYVWTVVYTATNNLFINRFSKFF